MEIKQLKYFVTVAEVQTIGAAARKLHISQPPLSRHIRRLEQEIGGELFIRTSKGVQLTDAGQTLLVEARRILEHVERAVQRARSASIGEIGELDVGSTGSVIVCAVPDVLRQFRDRFPSVRVSLHRMGIHEQIDALQRGSLHIAFARYFPLEPGLEKVLVDMERPILAVANSSDLNHQNICLTELVNYPLIVYPKFDPPNFVNAVIGTFKQANVEPEIVHIADDMASAMALTSAGIGACLVPSTIAALRWPGIRYLTITDVEPIIPTYCMFRTSSMAPLVKSFFETLSIYKNSKQVQKQ